MKRILCAASALTLMFGASGAAFAQPGYGHDRQGGYDQQHQGYSHDSRNDRNDRHATWDHRHPDWRSGHRMARNDWRRGHRVDYRAHHLRAPPRGYEWREVDGDYVLAAAATGLIASIIANSR